MIIIVQEFYAVYSDYVVHLTLCNIFNLYFRCFKITNLYTWRVHVEASAPPPSSMHLASINKEEMAFDKLTLINPTFHIPLRSLLLHVRSK